MIQAIINKSTGEQKMKYAWIGKGNVLFEAKFNLIHAAVISE